MVISNNVKSKRFNVPLIVLSLFIFIVSCGEKLTDKASEFMDANMYDQAITLLQQEINNNPKNEDAHFLLGECMLVINRLPSAKKSFKSATLLNPDLGMKIGDVAMSAANAALLEKKYNQAYQIMLLAKNYDPKTEKISSEIWKIKATELFGNSLISEGISFFEYSLSLDPLADKEISDLLMSQITMDIQNLTENSNLDKIISLTLKIDETKAKNIGQLFFNKSTKILETNTQFATGVKAANSAGVYDSELSESLSELLIEYAQNSYEQEQLETFQKAIDLAIGFNPEILTVASDRIVCIEALYSYQTGNRVQAIKELKKLRNSSNDFAKKTANKLLSPPSVGIHAVGKSTSWNNLGWSGPMSITLDDFEVTKGNKIILHFVAVNKANKSNILMYGYSDRYNRGEEKSWYPNIVDDNGIKSLPLVNFQGGEQESGNNSGQCRNILFNKDQSIELTITFPITSEGASKFHFVSPSLNGWQWEWSIEDIALR